MLIPHTSGRLIVVVFLALLLGTVAEEASTKMVSTFASSVVSGWLDAVAPLEIPALATIPAAVTAVATRANGTPSEFQASGAQAAAVLFGESVDGVELNGAGGAQPLPQAMPSALAELFDIGAGGSASSGGSGAGGQNPDRQGGGSQVSGADAAGGGAPGGQLNSGGSGLLREALRQLAEETSSPEMPFGRDLETFGESAADSFLAAVPTLRNRQTEPDGLPGGPPGSDNGGRVPNSLRFADSVSPGADSLQLLGPALAPVLNALLPVESAIGAASPLAVVPEPPTLVLFGSGLMGLAAWCRRAKTKREAVTVRAI